MDKSHRHNDERKKTDTAEYILFDSINVTFKNRQNKSRVTEIIIWVITWQKAVIDCEATQVGLLVAAGDFILN